MQEAEPVTRPVGVQTPTCGRPDPDPDLWVFLLLLAAVAVGL